MVSTSKKEREQIIIKIYWFLHLQNIFKHLWWLRSFSMKTEQKL